MRAKSLLLLMLALGCGLVASIGITQVMAKRAPTTSAPAADSTTIFVALDNIPMGEPITPQLIKLEAWPKDMVPSGALTKLEEVEGRRPKATIYKGAPVLENLLLPKGVAQGAAVEIPKGYRVMAVKVDDVSGSASLIRPGDRVDVLAHFQRNPGKGIDLTKTQTILEDVKVFAVNDVYDLDAAGEEKKLSARTVSLLVTPDQAEKLTLAAELGKLRLIMRSFEDDGHVNSQGASPEDLFGNTEKADRSKDDPIPSSQPLASPNPANEFLEFLAKAKQPESAPTMDVEGPAEPNNWKMRVIAAAQVNDVVLEIEEDSATESLQGSPRWKTTPSMVPGTPPAAPAEIQPVEDTKPTEDTQLEPDEPTQSDESTEDDQRTEPEEN